MVDPARLVDGPAADSVAPTPTKSATGKRLRRGGQPGNLNSFQHGLRSGQSVGGHASDTCASYKSDYRHGLGGGKLRKGCKYIEQRVNSLRRQVEEAILAVKGEIGIVDAAAINSILKWERHGLLAAHWLRKQVDELSASDRLRFSEAIARASDNRDRNIRMLGLTIKPPDPWLALNSPGPNATDDDAGDDAEDETDDAANSARATSPSPGDGKALNADAAGGCDK